MVRIPAKRGIASASSGPIGALPVSGCSEGGMTGTHRLKRFGGQGAVAPTHDDLPASPCRARAIDSARDLEAKASNTTSTMGVRVILDALAFWGARFPGPVTDGLWLTRTFVGWQLDA